MGISKEPPLTSFATHCDWRTVHTIGYQKQPNSGGSYWERGQTNVSTCTLPELRGLRLGPYKSEAGYRIMTTNIEVGGLGIINPGDRVTVFAGQPVTSSGVVISMPPLFVHHLHVNKLSPAHINFHYFETHADFAVGTDPDSFGEGASSALGYSRYMPSGYVMVVDRSALDIWGDVTVDDVRSKEANGTALEYYLEFAFRLAPPQLKLRPVSLFWMFQPCDGLYHELSTSFGNGFNTFNVQAHDTLVWWSGVMPADGKLLPENPWLHTHRARFAGFLLLKASLSALNFSCDEFGVSEVSGEHSRAADLTAIRARLMQSGQVVCYDDPTVADYITIKGSPREGVAAGVYERQGRVRCTPWSFTRGERYSIFGFFKPRFRTIARHMGMHLALFLHVDLQSDKSVDAILVFVAPSPPLTAPSRPPTHLAPPPYTSHPTALCPTDAMLRPPSLLTLTVVLTLSLSLTGGRKLQPVHPQGRAPPFGVGPVGRARKPLAACYRIRPSPP